MQQFLRENFVLFRLNATLKVVHLYSPNTTDLHHNNSQCYYVQYT